MDTTELLRKHLQTQKQALDAAIADVRGAACPPGHYCPQGSTGPTHCPTGKFAGTPLLEAPGDCEDCTAGYYCPNTATVGPVERCTAGYVEQKLIFKSISSTNM